MTFDTQTLKNYVIKQQLNHKNGALKKLNSSKITFLALQRSNKINQLNKDEIIRRFNKLGGSGGADIFERKHKGEAAVLAWSWHS